jgi:short-subunit dehydrogenase
MQIEPGTRALITGPSRGIGRALAHALAERGAVLGLASRSEEELAALAAELPGEHHVLPCDVGDRAQVQATVSDFVERAGGLELVVANAGVAHYGPFHALDIEKAEQMTRVNWLGTLYTVDAALPHLLGRAHGHIVVVSSGAGWRTFPGAAVYGATKAAQRGFAEGLRHELSGSGVSLTTVFPGEIASNLHDHDKGLMPDWYKGGPDAAPAEDLATAIIKGIEEDRRHVFFPPLVRLLAGVHGLSPRLSDAILRRLRGGTAAPRRD